MSVERPHATERVLKVEQVAQLLGVSAWSIYEAIKPREIPAIHVGRRILVPTHALRGWMSDSASRHDEAMARERPYKIPTIFPRSVAGTGSPVCQGDVRQLQ